DDDVQVDYGPALEFGGPAVGEFDRGGVDAALRGSPLEEPFGGDAGASPELAIEVVPHDLCRAVVAVQAQRGAAGFVFVVVAGKARHDAAVRAAGRVSSGMAGFGTAVAAPAIGAGVPAGDPGVYRAERGCGQRREDRRVLGDSLRDAFAA